MLCRGNPRRGSNLLRPGGTQEPRVVAYRRLLREQDSHFAPLVPGRNKLLPLQGTLGFRISFCGRQVLFPHFPANSAPNPFIQGEMYTNPHYFGHVYMRNALSERHELNKM